MHIGEIHAGSSNFFPNIWYRIQPENVNAFICKRKHHFHNLIEHLGIAVIQIPLEFIKPGHHILSDILIISKISRRHLWKYLCQSLLIFPGYGIIIKHKIHIIIVMIPFFIFLDPDMFFRRMIQHKINTSAYSLLFQQLHHPF